MKAVFVFGKVPEEFLSQTDRECTYYVDTLELEQKLLKLGVRCSYLYRDKSERFNSIAEEALVWLQNFGDAPISGEDSFNTLFQYKGIPLWFLSYDAIFEIKHGIFDVFYHAALFDEILNDHEMVDSISNEESLIEGVLRKVANVKKISVKSIPFPLTRVEVNTEKTKPKRLNQHIWQQLNLLVIHRSIRVLRLMFSMRRKYTDQKRVAVLSSYGKMSCKKTMPNGGVEVEDVYCKGLETLTADCLESPDYISVNTPRLHGNKLKDEMYEWFLILKGHYSSWGSYGAISDIILSLFQQYGFRREINRIQNNDAFREQFVFRGVNLNEFIAPMLTGLLPKLMASAVRHMKMSERMVRLLKIEILFSVEACSNLGRSLAWAMHRHQGKLFGIQAGIITPAKVTNVGYFFSNVSPDFSKELMPDQLFVWGDSYKQLLIRYGVPQNIIHVVGFFRALEVKSQRQPGSGRIRPSDLLYIAGANTQVCPYLMTEEEEFYSIRRMASALPSDSKLFVRPHPRHHPMRYFKEFENFSNIVVLASSEEGLDELLSSATWVAGKASTVLLEAAAMNKAIIKVNLAGTIDFTGFDKIDEYPFLINADNVDELIELLLRPENNFFPTEKVLHEFKKMWCKDVGKTNKQLMHSEEYLS